MDRLVYSSSEFDARAKLEDALWTWESYLAAALRRMQERGQRDAVVDLAELGAEVLAALQRGLALAHTRCSEQPMRTALGPAVDRVALAAAPAGHVELRWGKGSLIRTPVPGQEDERAIR